MFGAWALAQVALVFVGCWWCKEIFGRLRDDLAEFRTADRTSRAATLLIWAVTAVILYLICTFLLTTATNVYHEW